MFLSRTVIADQCTSYLWSGVASITQPRQLSATNILMHAPNSGLFRVVTSQNGCYTENVSLFSLIKAVGTGQA